MPDNTKKIAIKAGKDNIAQWTITDEKTIALKRIAKSLESIEKILTKLILKDNPD